MGTSQIVVTILLALFLGGGGLFYGARQIHTLRQMNLDDQSPPEERRHFRRQAWRRLISAALLLVMALLLGGSFFIEDRAEALAEEARAAEARGEPSLPRDEDKPFIRFWLGYWIAFLLVLLVILGLAFWDLIALRRFGNKAFQKIQADRRAMIERQANRLRQQRNGHAGE